MKRNILIACGLLGCVLTLQAQTKEGGIDAQMLQQIRKAGPTAADRALANAIATNPGRAYKTRKVQDAAGSSRD